MAKISINIYNNIIKKKKMGGGNSNHGSTHGSRVLGWPKQIKVSVVPKCHDSEIVYEREMRNFLAHSSTFNPVQKQ